MSAMTDQVEKQVKAGKRVVDRTFHVVEEQVAPIVKRVGPAMSTRRAQIASGVVVGALLALGIGMVVFQRRRRSTLAARIQRALPDEVVARANAIKRALG
ncbi:MAG TPA: hypothetical protein VF383_05810 [Candidatus Dormibacteraeota bacterium]